MAVSEFRMRAGVGEHHLELDGVDVSNQVQRMTLDVNSNDLARLYIERNGVGVVEGKALVLERLDDRQSVIAWLDEVDPERLEQEALESLGGLEQEGPGSVGEAIVRKLKEWASGDADRT